MNRLLAALPAEERAKLHPLLTSVSLKRGQVLQRQAERIRYVYFPNGGIVSLATVLSDGASVEAATIGSDGLVGVDAFFVDESLSPCNAIVQVLGAENSAWRMHVADFRRAIATSKPLHAATAAFALALIARIARLTACNVRHDIHERCARWLLAADDCMERQPFHISQEFLAVMLGVRRQAVSGVVGTFRRAGVIAYKRGNIKVYDRAALNKAACECYSAIARLYDDIYQKI